MKAKEFGEEEIIAAFRRAEARAKTMERCRRRWFSEATYHNWKAKQAGTKVTELRRLKELEAESNKPTELPATLRGSGE